MSSESDSFVFFFLGVFVFDSSFMGFFFVVVLVFFVVVARGVLVVARVAFGVVLFVFRAGIVFFCFEVRAFIVKYLT